MKFINTLLLLLGFFILTSNVSVAETPTVNQQLTVYYFHNTARCYSCKKIEQYTEEAIKSHFSKAIKNGTLVWKPLNLDEGENKRFIAKYSLFTKSVIVTKTINGKETEWKNLDKVWQLLRDEQAFKVYIQDEILQLLAQKKEL